jgi:hypothetical protein
VSDVARQLGLRPGDAELASSGTTCTHDLSSFGLSLARSDQSRDTVRAGVEADLRAYGWEDGLVIGPSPGRLVVVAMALTGFPVLRYLGRLLKRPALVDG